MIALIAQIHLYLFYYIFSPPKTLILTVLSSYSSSSLCPLKLCHRPTLFKFSTTTASTPKIFVAISVGNKLPKATFGYCNPNNKIKIVTVSDLTKNKKAILFVVPGAFTPNCSQKTPLGFVEKATELKAKGVDTIACIFVNDAFMMKAWKKDLNIRDEVMLLSNGNETFTKAIGRELDLSDKAMGCSVINGGNDIRVLSLPPTTPNLIL